jgi:hypothetical protein
MRRVIFDIIDLVKERLILKLTGDELIEPIDARGIPTSSCPACDGNRFNIIAMFDDEYELSAYMLDAVCADCGSWVTAPTPEDFVRMD